ncbi:unnamed protein product [Mytilus edulis]|uniref:Uncharacterized protein n=1 Tax=Mytilus edulis TaxID=6550 RepID=A0A8S3UVP8_MYTED|nr:unnamed protein product [Mytilus edulis]
MASLASEATGGEYQQRLDVIQSITDFWSHGKKCMVLEVLESDSVESTSSSGNEHEQTDVHVNEDIEDINDDINRLNYSFARRRTKYTSTRRTRYTSTRRTPPGFQMLWIACFAHITATKYQETWKVKIKKRGRSKGLIQSVIGLPKKRIRKSNCLPFHKKSSKDIGFLILEWFVGSDLAKNNNI